jgi:hypothetical protein
VTPNTLTVSRRSPVPTLIALLATLAWGVFAFGGTYWWASWPLMVGCLVSGVVGWSWGRPGVSSALLVCLGLVAAAVAVQLVPLRPAMVGSLSANTPAVLADLSPAFARGQWHALSITPFATAQGLALFVAFAVLLAGTTRFLSSVGARAVVIGITALGVILALFGIGQKTAGRGPIYGLWSPYMSGDPFGPFVNRNRFAGWMLMALPLTLGWLCLGVSRGLRDVRPTWRDRLLWLGSRDASEVILAAAAAIVMGLALVMTMSRSGISAFVLAVGITGAFVLRGMRASGKRSVAWAYLTGLVILVAVWVGVDAIASRFAAAEWSDINGRRAAWSDAASIGRRFLVAGTGLNTYATATIFFQSPGLEGHFEQAHNDYLQLFAEGGLLLLIPAGLAGLVMVRDGLAALPRGRVRQ